MIKRLVKPILEHFPLLSNFLRQSRDQLDKNAPARMTKWGFTLAGNDAMASGAFEPEETAVVRRLLLEVDILVNVGANVGYYCCHALSLGKPVIAFEPIARNLHYLLTNIRNNGWSQSAEVFPLALGSKTNIVQIFGGGTGASLVKGWASTPESYFTMVPLLSLDRVLGVVNKDRRALILVDIEGAEFMMLQGAIQTLNHIPKPIWLMEISVSHGQEINQNFTNTFDLFLNHGYSVFMANHDQTPISRQDLNQIIMGLKVLPTNNFLFI